MTKKKIAGYARVSTEKQRNDGVSIEMQVNLIYKYALSNKIVKKQKEITYYVDNGFSGGTLNRPEMNNLISCVENDEIKCIIVYDLSRMSRSIYDNCTLFELFKTHDVQLMFISDNGGLTTANDRFCLNLKMMFNQYERERTVEKTFDAMLSIVESGRYPYGGRTSFGFYRDENKNLCVDEEKAELIRKIYEMATKGMNLSQITNYFNGAQNEKIYSNDGVKRILKNPLYTGVFSFGGKIYENIVPQIVTPEQQQKAVKNLKHIRKANSKTYIFEKVLKCSNCGTRLQSVHAQGRRKFKYYYYMCKKCKKAIPQVKLIEYFYEIPVKCCDESKDSHIHLQKTAESLKKKKERIINEYAMERYSPEEYLMLINPLKERIASIENELEIAEKVAAHKTISIEKGMTYEQMRQIIQSNVSSVEVDMEEKKVVSVKCYIDIK